MKSTQAKSGFGVIILAAGKGKRMRSSLPKVLLEFGGRPLLFHILDRILEVAPKSKIGLVVGHAREQVETQVRSEKKYASLSIEFIHQKDQKGTGDAAREAIDSPWGESLMKSKSPVLVLPGDLPLISNELISEMLEPLPTTVSMRLLTCELSDPTGYGRIVRKGKTGPVLRITEERDANVREKGIKEVGTSIYTFQPGFLKSGLSRIQNKNSQGEFYLTDLVALASRSKMKIEVLPWETIEDLRGINDPWELALAQGLLNQRLLRFWALKGVRFLDPSTTLLETGVELDEEVVVGPGVQLQGRTQIKRGVILESRCVVKNTFVGESARLKTGTVTEDSIIEEGATLGPYAHLRPQSHVGAHAKIGNFVELKKSTIGAHTSVAHLSYLGDATVGERVNIGCGFITCNFDGRSINGQRKHPTTIEDDVFMGSDCQTVAPVTIGRGAYIASGSTITENVESESLAIARARQVNKPGYAKNLKTETESEVPKGRRGETPCVES